MIIQPIGEAGGLSDGGWCQRWYRRSPAWQHHDGPGFDPSRYAVVDIDENPARRFVVEHHYSGTWPAARLRYGLIDRTPHLGAYPNPDPSALTPLGRVLGLVLGGEQDSQHLLGGEVRLPGLGPCQVVHHLAAPAPTRSSW